MTSILFYLLYLLGAQRPADEMVEAWTRLREAIALGVASRWW